MFDIYKMIQIVNHVIERYAGTINYTKLIKELYLADRQCLLEHGYTISENRLICMPLGPVLENLYQLIRGEYDDINAQTEWNEFFYTSGYDLLRINDKTLPEDRLSPNEIQILDGIESRFHDLDYAAMIDEVHNLSQYPEVVTTSSSCDLALQAIMKAAGVKPAEIALWEKEKEFEEKLDCVLRD